MAWEVALAVGGSLTGVAVVVALVMVVAMCTVSRHRCKQKYAQLNTLLILQKSPPPTPVGKKKTYY